MHVITTFVELSNPFPHHSITHDIFTVHFTYLTMNISRFYISFIQKTDKGPYFTVGGALDYLEYFKRTEQYINPMCFYRIGVCGLSVNEGRQVRMRKIMTSALRRKYSQTVLTFRIRFLYIRNSLFFCSNKNSKNLIEFSSHHFSIRSLHNWGKHDTVGRTYGKVLCDQLSLSQLPRYNLQICVRPDFASALRTDSRLATNYT